MSGATERRHTETDFYETAKKAVEKQFRRNGYDVEFMVLGRKKKIPERFLRGNRVLAKYNPGLPVPDVMGLVQRRRTGSKEELVVVEFKLKPQFWDIFQVKGYAQLFNADFTLLLSQYPMYESSQKVVEFVRSNEGLLETGHGRGKIAVMELHQTLDGEVLLAQLVPETPVFPDLELWYRPNW